MDAANQRASASADVAEEASENEAKNEEIPMSANSTETEDQQNKSENTEEAGTSGDNKSLTTENKAPVKRNYRRRTESGDESSRDSAAEPPAPTVENAVEDQQPADASESEDVSLDELRVSGSEAENNQSPRR